MAGWLVSFGNLGGIIGSFIYMDHEAPAYTTGFGLLSAFAGSAMVAIFVLWCSFKRENVARSKLSEEDVRSKYSEKELLLKGDRSPLFKYTL